MDFELDPFSDILAGPSSDNTNAKAGAKFQPKAKARLKKESKPTLTSNLANATPTEGKTDATGFPEQNFLHPPSPVLASTSAECLTNPMDTSNIFESEELVRRTEVSHSGFPFSNDERPSASPLHVNTKDDMDFTYAKPTESYTHKDLQSAFPGLGETADIFPELEVFDNILSPSTTTNASATRKFQPKVKGNAQLKNKPPPSGTVTNDFPEPSLTGASNVGEFVTTSDIPAFSSNGLSVLQSCVSVPRDASPKDRASQDPISSQEVGNFNFSGDFLIDAGRLNREEAEAFPCLESFGVLDQADANAGDGKLMASDNKHLEEDLASEFPTQGFHEVSTLETSASPPNHTPSEFHVPEQLENVAVASDLNATALDDLADSHVIFETFNNEKTRNRKRNGKVTSREVGRGVRSRDSEKHPQGNQDENLTTGEGNDAAKSKMELRKRRNTSSAEFLENGSQVNGDIMDDVTGDSLMDQDLNNSDGDEYKEEATPCLKKAPKRSKKPAVKNGKTVRRSKKAEEAGKLNEDPPKKKFSHSTRRNKRQVNKVLLESEEVLDPKKLMIKDLILLAEAKERMSNKDSAASKNPLPNERSFTWDAAASYGEDPFASGQENPDNGGGVNKIDESSVKLNYHSYMEKAPKERWSKHDTELFYKGIQQFGTDFAMIQQLFPGRTRHQVKLKYKKEERQHPLKVYDALTNRSKDHSHFELVIERLQQAAAAAAEADQNSSGDMESAGGTGEEENTAETNDDEGNVKADEEEEEGTENLDDDGIKVSTTRKSYKSQDSPYSCSQYKSDYDDYVC